jgi:hypothetical protein
MSLVTAAATRALKVLCFELGLARRGGARECAKVTFGQESRGSGAGGPTRSERSEDRRMGRSQGGFSRQPVRTLINIGYVERKSR